MWCDGFNNLVAHIRSVFNGVYVFIKNHFSGENEWDFYFWNHLLLGTYSINLPFILTSWLLYTVFIRNQV